MKGLVHGYVVYGALRSISLYNGCLVKGFQFAGGGSWETGCYHDSFSLNTQHDLEGKRLLS